MKRIKVKGSFELWNRLTAIYHYDVRASLKYELRNDLKHEFIELLENLIGFSCLEKI